MRRRGLLGLLLAPLAIRGTGGTSDQPPGYVPPSLPGQAAGSPSQVIRARQVIITGANGELLVYNPAIAHGDLAVSIAGVAGTGLASDTVVAGVAAYDSSGDYAQLFSAALNFVIVGMFQAAGLSMPASGEIQLDSGLQTNLDTAASILLLSALANGGASGITLNAATVTATSNLTVNGTLTVGGSTTTGACNNNLFGLTTSGASAGTAHTHTLPFQNPTATHTHNL